MFKNILLTSFILLLLSNFIYAQISPGDLTKAHADLEGMSNCTKCHELGEKVYNSKCLDCHTEIKALINAGRGYHSGSEVKGKECYSCHSEHHGRNFRIINFNPDNFNHSKTGFNLEGVHQKKECKDCHQSKFISDSKLKKRSSTYLGLDTKCASCHEDVHQTTLGNNCGSCHNNNSFKPVTSFDHNKAAFKLSGSHEKVECSKCHLSEKRNGKDFVKFKGTSFATCASCHKDPHQGKFGSNCQSCHSTVSFQQINTGSFDHNKTSFPLAGRHTRVKCDNCHKEGLTKKIKHENCFDCHEDYHKGAFVLNDKTKDCKECHTETGFSPSLFGYDNHQKAAFALTGMHMAVPCINCHRKDEEPWKFRQIGLKCIDCHQNIHRTELAAEYLSNNDCSSCHSVDAWHTIKFDHNKTDFKLLGKHSEATCADCHNKKGETKTVTIFSSIKSNCEFCHTDIHFGQFKVGETSDCSNCHTFDNWKPEKFDHEKTRFSLKGAHEKLKCIQCHKVESYETSLFVKFKMEDFKCASCHS
ncbi:MAG: cytochrome C [Ignavibacteriales bacterium]|nr:MAG: cytochrome C [Ignavibacteriales bacterium]